MKLTKYAHACVVLEQDDSSLIIDPGNFTDNMNMPANVVSVIITHLHPDHCDKEKLQAIITANPTAIVYGLAEIVEHAGVPVTSVNPGEKLSIGGFELEFTGGIHATIHPDLPGIGNLGVVVNRDVFYYPGDSFAQPPRHMKWIATPVAAPWMKTSEAVEFLREAQPIHAIPTHDAILSPVGHALVDRVVSGLIDESIDYRRIAIGTSVEL